MEKMWRIKNDMISIAVHTMVRKKANIEIASNMPKNVSIIILLYTF